MLKRERTRTASVGATRAGASDGRARPRRVLRPDLESLESRQLLTAVSEFPLRSAGSFSEYIAVGPDKNLWFTLQSNNVGRVNPQTGKVDQYPIPTPNSLPQEIINGPDNKLWFIET